MPHPLLSLTPEQAKAVIARINALPTAAERFRNPLPPPAPPPWIVPVQQAALTVFLEKLHRVKPHGSHRPVSDLRKLFKTWSGQCAYCGCKLSHPDADSADPAMRRPCADHLLPVAAGGLVNSVEVLACSPCHAKKGGLDWLAWGNARSPKVRKRLIALRMEASHFAFNHLSQDRVKVRTDLMIGRMLDARWQHPRFRIYASATSGGCFIGWQTNWFVPQAALFILKGLKGQPVVDVPGLTVFAFDRPADALQAIWALIDCNGWVLGFDLEPEGFPDITPESAPQWRFWSPNFKDLRTRTLTKARRKWKKENRRRHD